MTGDFISISIFFLFGRVLIDWINRIVTPYAYNNNHNHNHTALPQVLLQVHLAIHDQLLWSIQFPRYANNPNRNPHRPCSCYQNWVFYKSSGSDIDITPGPGICIGDITIILSINLLLIYNNKPPRIRRAIKHCVPFPFKSRLPSSSPPTASRKK